MPKAVASEIRPKVLFAIVLSSTSSSPCLLSHVVHASIGKLPINVKIEPTSTNGIAISTPSRSAFRCRCAATFSPNGAILLARKSIDAVRAIISSS